MFQTSYLPDYCWLKPKNCKRLIHKSQLCSAHCPGRVSKPRNLSINLGRAPRYLAFWCFKKELKLLEEVAVLTFPSLLLAVMALAGALAGGGLSSPPRRPRSSPTPALTTPHPSLSLTATYTRTHTHPLLPITQNQTITPASMPCTNHWTQNMFTGSALLLQNRNRELILFLQLWDYGNKLWPQSDTKLSVEPGLKAQTLLSIYQTCVCCRHRLVPPIVFLQE